MKLIAHHDAFLNEVVNLRPARLQQLNDRVTAVENFLAKVDHPVGENFLGLIPQGSFAQRTIINPVGDRDEFDADVLLDMNEVDGWDADDYVDELYKALRTSGTYRDMVNRRSRCVTVDYANAFHIDVVPYLTRHDERYITNRSTNEYERTDPEAFNAWLDEQNRLSRGRLTKVIRLMKYLRDYKNNYTIASVIQSILLGERVSATRLWSDENYYADLPTALKNIVRDLDIYLQDHVEMPQIEDPGCAGETYNHRWNQEQYANYRKWIHTYAAWIEDAYEERDREESIRKWRKLFGDGFASTSTQVKKAATAHLSRTDVRNTEQFIDTDLGYPYSLDPNYRVKLGARAGVRRGFQKYDLSTRGNKVRKGNDIRFNIREITVPQPYDLYWKVRNTGEAALDADCLRGNILRDNGSLQRVEPTSYVGKHYVEVYVVKDGSVVAMDHHDVVIT